MKTAIWLGTALAMLSFPASADKLPVVASFSILGDLVQQVGGDKVDVKTLVGPDGDAHVYQPSPQDGKTLASARLVVLNGLAFEGWMDRLARASRYQGTKVIASDKVKTSEIEGHDHTGHAHTHGKIDPHAWQDPNNVRQYVANIAAGLTKADPANGAYYQQQAKHYELELVALEKWAAEQLARIPPAKRRVITSHDAFGYLGHRFQITFLAPQGMNTDAEASAKDVGLLIRQARREGIKAIFVENVSNPKLLEQISRESGAKVGGRLYSDALSKADGPAGNYIKMMRYNISTLVEGMKQN
ncbi:metal ABC transporter substrate-binding protein [Chitinimonas sp. BJB300]|uniref:metal ABC transporter substrate-binding protein n=1 Tax=Chitinimonas sp. BJB300 TaxID=1559339 RepID=UPI000C0D4C13|nr:metal ABC transporter substrate-binding protein [Chitinimonas sp. BJB300]PHV11082.1 metal ABC transporter substrate-binding protein [Chitinimonas sp. BJB300]TSJ89701.1 metal ABC transporter substrate-binding protein [Chitinimonas sp. BJB300]